MSTTTWQEWLDQHLSGHCALCETQVLGLALCPYCQRSLPIVPAPCGICALPKQSYCAHPPAWQLQALVAPFAYTTHIKLLIGRLKFGRQRWLGQMLGELLRSAHDVGDYDLCVPVPLHARRLAQRGFNQAQEIAVGMTPARAGMKLARVLRRVRDTPPQTQLSATARHNNLVGCFEVIANVQSQRVLLVDDVVTTGSTMNTLAILLREYGACFVGGLAVARTVAPYTAKV